MHYVLKIKGKDTFSLNKIILKQMSLMYFDFKFSLSSSIMFSIVFNTWKINVGALLALYNSV